MAAATLAMARAARLAGDLTLATHDEGRGEDLLVSALERITERDALLPLLEALIGDLPQEEQLELIDSMDRVGVIADLLMAEWEGSMERDPRSLPAWALACDLL